MAIAAAGLTLALQGWQSRELDRDVADAISQAAALVREGRIPQHGTLTNFQSYFPPGTSWLTLPGVLVFTDARRAELLGSAALYLGTLAGVLLIGRRYFGDAIALLAVLLYAFAPAALALAAGLWPRGHPFFYIWIAYFAGLWVERRDGRYLAAGCVTWAAGMYVYLEAAPAILILPAVWYLYRPPISPRAVAAVATVALVMWLPYLIFEWDRGFADVQSQLLMQPLDPRWLDPAAVECWLGADAASPLPPAAGGRLGTMADLALAGLPARALGGDFVLLVLVAAGVLATGIFVGGRNRASALVNRHLRTLAVLLTTSILATEFILRWIAPIASPLAGHLVNTRRVHVWLVVALLALVAADPRVEGLAASLRRRWNRGDHARVVAVALLVPWLTLLVLTEEGRWDRMFGVAPFQALMIAAFVCAVREQLPADSYRRLVWVPLVVALAIANPVVLERAREWASHGWSGRSPGPAALIDSGLSPCREARFKPRGPA